LLCCIIVLVACVNVDIDEERFVNDYEAYCQHFNKESTIEGKLTYFENVAKVIKHNSNPKKTWSMGINRFTDMSEEQRKTWKGYYDPLLKGETLYNSAPLADLPLAPPDSWDWRSHGAVNPIKDQGACGVCWAFASAGATESAHFIDQKQLVSLSESQLAECDTTSGGCNECAFTWYKSNRPCSESSYPYECPAKTCRSCAVATTAIKSFAVVHQSNETALKAAVYDRPVAIGIAAAGDFMSYRSGIFTGSCPGGRDHAVVIVGYGTENGQNFWILRNSWNTGWGESGYMRVARGGHGADGMCLLATDPSVPYFNK